MTQKRKAAFPSKAGTLGEAAFEQRKNQRNNIIIHPDSQPQRLLAALQAGPVTMVNAVYGMTIPHPASCVHRLRLQGYTIRTELLPVEFPDGRWVWAAEYHLLAQVGHV